MVDPDFFNEVPIFELLDAEERKGLADRVSIREFKKGDPYPFILLNLFLSMLAAIQAPVIMMSQNRQDSKDRLRSELDYRVNLKAELEIEDWLQRIGKIEEILVEHTNRDDE